MRLTTGDCWELGENKASRDKIAVQLCYAICYNIHIGNCMALWQPCILKLKEPELKALGGANISEPI